MNNNRLFKIVYYLLKHGRSTAVELSEKLEVSVRTVYRDIDSIGSANIPIYAIQGKGGGIEIDPDFIISKSLLSENEKEQIIIALQSLKQTDSLYKDDLLVKLSALFKVKNHNWVEVDFTNWQNNENYKKVFNDIKFAIINKKVMSFSYYSSNEEETVRKVKPVRLLFKGQDWYLYAFCMLRNDFRYFKLVRIKQLEILSDEFEDDFEALILNKEMKQEDMIKVKLKFDKKVAYRVYDELGENIVEDNADDLYVEIEFGNDYNLYNYVFSFGDAVEVIYPEEIRVKIKEMAEKIQQKYKT